MTFRRLCDEFGFKFEGTMDLFCDNRQTIRLVKEELWQCGCAGVCVLSYA